MNLSVLKPSVSKIILAVILFLIVVPFINYDNGLRCIMAPCPSDSTGSVVTYLASSQSYIYDIYYGYAVLGLILSYLAACVIVYLLVKKK